MDITEEAVESVARILWGSAGPSGTYLEALQRWLLKFGDYRRKLRISVKSFVDWMANQNPACDAYRLFMSGRLIALDKLPGVSPVGVGEMWCHIFTKCVLKVTGSEAPHVCRDGQICTGLELEIDGWVHGVQSTREANLTEENGIFYLLTQRTHLTISIKLEYCGRSAIYGCLELVLFLTDIVTTSILS